MKKLPKHQEIRAAIALGIACAFASFLLAGCDGELERLQKQADWREKFSRVALPDEGELVTIRQLGEKSYAVRRYKGGLLSTQILTRDE